MTFQLVQWVDQSELVRVEQHSDKNEARQRGCGLSAVGRAVLCGQRLSTVKGRPGRGGRGGGWVGGWLVGAALNVLVSRQSVANTLSVRRMLPSSG